MVGLNIKGVTGLSIRSRFFDRKKVIKAVDEATRKVLSKFGAFVRTSMKSSIRKAKGPSQPGKPPHSHYGLLKDLIYFGFDTKTRSVVIGPETAGKKNDAFKKKPPHILEHGGPTIMENWALSGAERKKYPKGKKIVIKKRPYANPALEKNIDLLPPMWRNSVKPA